MDFEINVRRSRFVNEKKSLPILLIEHTHIFHINEIDDVLLYFVFSVY